MSAEGSRGSDDQPPRDLAGVGHWDDVYQTIDTRATANWRPQHYDDHTLDHGLSREIERCRPGSMLEIGCGNSVWLPYLAKKWQVPVVAGLDYSELGCELARRRMALEGVAGKVFCDDLFRVEPDTIGRYDLVYSIGLVEHFDDLEAVLRCISRFVRPGGTLVTEVPNLHRSLHGFLSWVWVPTVLAKHHPVGRSKLMSACQSIGLLDVRGSFMGWFSLIIVSWHVGQRFPGLARYVIPIVDRIRERTSAPLMRLGFGGISPLAPYLIVAGTRPEDRSGTADERMDR